MTETTIVAPVIETQSGSQAAFSWNVAIAGALAAIAVSILFYALGTGVGLSLVSPYSESNPSAGTMTAIGAVWLIMAQVFAFAIGGYMTAVGSAIRPPLTASPQTTTNLTDEKDLGHELDVSVAGHHVPDHPSRQAV